MTRAREETQIEVNPYIFAVARIWLAQINNVEASCTREALFYTGSHDQISVGHISLQLIRKVDGNRFETRYASFWPEKAVDSAYQVVRGSFQTLSEDIKSEGRVPNRTHYLFSLDNAALWDSMERECLERTYPYYTLIDGAVTREKVRKISNSFGSSLFSWRRFRFLSKPENEPTDEIQSKSCSGVIYDLVKNIGGLEHLSITTNLIRDYVVTNPDNMLKLFREAENNEREKWPETVDYKEEVADLLNKALYKV